MKRLNLPLLRPPGYHQTLRENIPLRDYGFADCKCDDAGGAFTGAIALSLELKAVARRQSSSGWGHG